MIDIHAAMSLTCLCGHHRDHCGSVETRQTTVLPVWQPSVRLKWSVTRIAKFESTVRTSYRTRLISETPTGCRGCAQVTGVTQEDRSWEPIIAKAIRGAPQK